VNQDAIRFEFPELPLVIYMFNPFRPEVLVPVFRNLQASLERFPRDVILLYQAAFHGKLIEHETTLVRVDHGPYHDTYRTTPDADQCIGHLGSRARPLRYIR